MRAPPGSPAAMRHRDSISISDHGSGILSRGDALGVGSGESKRGEEGDEDEADDPDVRRRASSRGKPFGGIGSGLSGAVRRGAADAELGIEIGHAADAMARAAPGGE